MGRFPMDSARRAGLMFTTGKRVEVSLEKEDYRDVWFPALVLDSADQSFLVEYHSPGITNKEGLVVVTVDHCHIRPTPPHLKDKKFGLLERVDAFYDFGWWSGVITKELRDGRYVVFFKHANKERKHNHSELRPHMEWKDGKWFTASQDISNPSPDHQGTAKNNETTAATPCNGEGSNYNPVEKYITKRTTPSGTFHAFQYSYKKLKGADVEKFPSQSNNTTLLDRPSNNTTSGGFASLTKINGGPEHPRVGGIQSSAKSDDPSCGKKFAAQVRGELGNQTCNTVNKRGREPESQASSPQVSARPKLQPSSSQASAGGKFSGVLQQFTRQRGKVVGDAARKTAEDLIEKEYVTKEVDKEKQSLSRDQKQLGDDDPLTQKITGSNQLGVAERTKKWGRSCKSPAKSPETPVEVVVEKQNGDVAAVEPMVKDCTKDVCCSVTAASKEASIPSTSKECRKLIGDGEKQLNSPLKPEKRSTIMSKKPVKKIRPKRKCVLLASKKQRQNQRTSNRARRRTISINTKSPIEGSREVSSARKAAEILEKDSSVKVIEMDAPSDASDYQPISVLIDGKQSPTTVNGPKSSTIRTVDECTERQKETGVELTVVNDEGESQEDENQSIPFVKNTLLWKTIESMEVFRLMPQKPHFRNLGTHKETSREGLAIGSMVNFSSVVENTSKLQFDDPRSIIEDNLDTLHELESYGFDVKLVRDRLTRLLLIKDKQEELEERSKEIKSRINEHDLETSDIDKEIDEIDKQIQELQERRAAAVSKKVKRDSEIGSLKSTVECIKDGMRDARIDFEGLAATPWSVNKHRF